MLIVLSVEYITQVIKEIEEEYGSILQTLGCGPLRENREQSNDIFLTVKSGIRVEFMKC
jgi:hypothetical protein